MDKSDSEIFKKETNSTCEICGTKFNCGAKTNDCWCLNLPKVMPVKGDSCWCPDCLKKKIENLG